MASIVTELLNPSQVDELLAKGIPLDRRSEVGSRIAELAGPALQAGVEGAGAVAPKGRYLVEFSAERTQELRTGAVALLRRVDGRLQPTLVDASAKIQENAVVVARAGGRAAGALAIGHTVVLLAVQAQLVAMERQLQRIEKKIDAVRRLLDDTQVSRVRGWLRKLAALRDEMSASSWVDADVQRWLKILDDADAEFLQVEELAKVQCADATSGIAKAHLKVWFLGPSGDALLEQFLDKAERYRQYYDLYGLTVLGRLVIAHVMRSLDRPHGLPQLREDITSLETSATAHQELIEQRAREFRTYFRGKEHEMKKSSAIIHGAADFRARSDVILNRLRAAANGLDWRSPRTERVIVEVGDTGACESLAILPQEGAS